MSAGEGMERLSTVVLGTALVAAALVVLSQRASGEDPAPAGGETPFEQSAVFKRTHEVMVAQQEQIHKLLDGFIRGDRSLIDEASEELAEEMNAVPLEHPPRTVQTEEAWDAVAKVREYAKEIRTEAAAGRRQEALQKFTAMTGQCMRCHEARRLWGRVPETAPDIPLERR